MENKHSFGGKSGTEDKVEGAFKNLSGKIKEGVGKAVGNRHLEAKGASERIDGRAQKTIGAVKNTFARQSPRTLMKLSLSASCLALMLGLTGAVFIGGFSAGCAATPTSDSTGQYVDDTSITTKVKSALLGDDAVKSFEIKVETVKGVVQLSGFVDTSIQKAAAEKDASAVAGVKNVQNNLIVK